jgi:hypothetical protein
MREERAIQRTIETWRRAGVLAVPSGHPPTRRHPRLASVAVLAVIAVVVAMLQSLVVLAPGLAPKAHAATACTGPGTPATCALTVDARDFVSGAPLANFNYIINLDNTKLPNDPLVLNTESNSPVVAEGDQTRTTVNLPAGRYLVSVRSLDHKMWGQHVTLPNPATADGSLTARIDLTRQSADNPLPLGKIRVFVFEDNAWANGAPDTEESGLSGFKIGLEEQTGNAVTVDYNNNPLCGGECLTDGTGFVEAEDLGPATYFIDVHPPEGPCNSDPNSAWYQTTTIDGGLQLLAPVEEGSDGTGAPGEQLWEPPNNRTAYWFGFVCSPQPFATPGTGEIVGQARNWVEWAPYTTGTFNDPVENAFVALSDASTDVTVYVGQADASGNFDIRNVPAGSYNLSVWDEQLSYIMRFKPLTVAAGATVDANETGDDGSVGLGVSRWFGWLDGHVYKDTNGNGMMDAGEPRLGNTDVDQRWRDGSIKEGTFTDTTGYYQYPTAEGGALGRWIVGEQGFARFSSYPGASVHDEHTGAVTPSCVVQPPALAPANPCIPNSAGGGLLVNQLLLEGHRATVDWGKRDYAAGTPGQIVGITYFATTRNEFFADKQAHEDYEPAIPDAVVYLESPGPDGLPNTDDDVVVNKYVTDHWSQPNASQDPQDPPGNTFTQSCNPIRDFNGDPITTPELSPRIGPNCLEVPLTGEQTKEGLFDGGYAFADYCPGGYDLAADDGTCVGGSDPVALVAGNYIVHSIMPNDPTDTRPCNPATETQRVTNAHGSVPGGGNGCLYHIVREEDVNVDLGNQFAPQIPPPPCNGDDHVIDQSTLVDRSVYFGVAGAHAPLCDKHLVVLENQQNANADFFLMTNFRTDPNGTAPVTAPDTRTGDVPVPGRLVGQVFNDIYFERNPQSPWYGEPRPIAGIPVGIYARVDTVCPGGGTSCATPNVNAPFDANHWRLLTTVTTSPDGSFEALVPSTETFNCPIPQGPCPGMYLVTVDDPGTTQHPNTNYNPNLLTATTPAEAWPGLTTQLDLPLDPISGTACELPPGGTTPDPLDPAVPELLQVNRPYVAAGSSGAARQVTIDGDFIGTGGTTAASTGHILLTDPRTGTVTDLTQTNGGIASWTPGTASTGTGGTADRIVVNIPAINTTTFRPGPKQLTIRSSNNNGAVSSVNGITIHVLGSNGSGATLVTYNPPLVPVGPWTLANPHVLQNAIDGAAAGSLLVLSPGTYNENLVLWKPLKLQGLGPGGIIGAHELQARDPEDPRFHVLGSVVDGRFFQQNATVYDATVAAHAPYAGVNTNHPVLRGAGLTLVAQSATAYDLTTASNLNQASFVAARVDGLGVTTGNGEGAGGIQLQAYANNTQLTNNVLENNGGVFAGGIAIGVPYSDITVPPNGPSDHIGSHNYNVRVANDRLIGNGGITRSGGLGIFYGSNNYEVANSVVCSNFGVEYGAGVSHWGLSPGGQIHDNQIYYNESFDSGAGLSIQTETPAGGGIGDGSGAVDVDRNLIQSNYSGDDGGGIFIQDGLTAAINIRNNQIVDNGAADVGGAIMLDDASNVRIVNNTVANNVTTASAEDSDGFPHSAGLASEGNDPAFQALLTNHTETVTTVSGSTTVADTSANLTVADVGKRVSGTRIPAALNSTILAVTPGVGFIMSRPAASSGSGSATITAQDFSNPSALFNNIFWNNNAFTLSQPGPGATLVDQGFIDFEVFGTTRAEDTFTPRFSLVTNGLILGPGLPGAQVPLPPNQGNTVGVDPGFVQPFVLELGVTGSRLDPQTAAVTITGADPPVGLTGNYHVAAAGLAALLASQVIDRGVRCSATPFPVPLNALTSCVTTGRGIEAPSVDYDNQARPRLSTVRVLTPWERGADEIAAPGLVLPLAGPAGPTLASRGPL